MFKTYLVTAMQNLWKRKLHTAINIAGLVLGTSCSLVIYVFITYEPGFDSFHSNSASIHPVVEDHQTA